MAGGPGDIGDILRQMQAGGGAPGTPATPPTPPAPPKKPEDKRKSVEGFSLRESGKPLKIKPSDLEDLEEGRVYPLAVYTIKGTGGTPDQTFLCQLRMEKGFLVARKVAADGDFAAGVPDLYYVCRYKPAADPSQPGTWDAKTCQDEASLAHELNLSHFPWWQQQWGPTPFDITDRVCYEMQIDPGILLNRKILFTGTDTSVPLGTRTIEMVPEETQLLLRRIASTNATDPGLLEELLTKHTLKPPDVNTRNKIIKDIIADGAVKNAALLNEPLRDAPTIKAYLQRVLTDPNNHQLWPNLLTNGQLTPQALAALHALKEGDPEPFADALNLSPAGRRQVIIDLQPVIGRHCAALQNNKIKPKIDRINAMLSGFNLSLYAFHTGDKTGWNHNFLNGLTPAALRTLQSTLGQFNRDDVKEVLRRYQALEQRKNGIDLRSQPRLTSAFDNLTRQIEVSCCTLPPSISKRALDRMTAQIEQIDRCFDLIRDRNPPEELNEAILELEAQQVELSKKLYGLDPDVYAQELVNKNKVLCELIEMRLAKLQEHLFRQQRAETTAYLFAGLEHERQQLVRLIHALERQLDELAETFIALRANDVSIPQVLIQHQWTLEELWKKTTDAKNLLPETTQQLTIVDQVPRKNEDGEIVMVTPGLEELAQGVPVGIKGINVAAVTLYAQRDEYDQPTSAAVVVDDNRGSEGQIKSADVAVKTFLEHHKPGNPIVLQHSNYEGDDVLKTYVTKLIQQGIPPEDITIPRVITHFTAPKGAWRIRKYIQSCFSWIERRNFTPEELLGKEAYRQLVPTGPAARR